jgi:hypothetical protein
MRKWEKTNVVLNTIIRKLESEYNRSGIGRGAWGMAHGAEISKCLFNRVRSTLCALRYALCHLPAPRNPKLATRTP